MSDNKQTPEEKFRTKAIHTRYDKKNGWVLVHADSLLETARELATGGEVEPDVILLPSDIPGVLIEINPKESDQ